MDLKNIKLTKPKIYGLVAVGALVLLTGANMVASSKAKSAIADAIGQTGVGYKSISCSSFITLNPSCTIKELGKDLGVMGGSVKIGNLRTLNSVSERGNGSVNLVLSVQGFSMAPQLGGLVGMFVSPSAIQGVRAWSEALGAKDLKLSLNGKLRFKDGDLRSIEKMQYKADAKWASVSSTFSSEFANGAMSVFSQRNPSYLSYLKEMEIDFRLKDRDRLLQAAIMMDEGGGLSKEEMRQKTKELDSTLKTEVGESLKEVREAISGFVRDGEFSAKQSKNALKAAQSVERFLTGDKNRIRVSIASKKGTLGDMLGDNLRELPSVLDFALAVDNSSTPFKLTIKN